MPLMSSAAILLQEHHLTLHSVLVDIPHDAAAIFIYIISAAAIGWVIKAGREKPDSEKPGEK